MSVLMVSKAVTVPAGSDLQHVSMSMPTLHVISAQFTLSLLESFTFGDVHALRVEHFAGAEQHLSVSADAEHDVPAQFTLSLLESFTFGDVHALRVEHFAGAEQHLSV
eukprot:COSAG01_NODE_1138_length_11546_cov_11.035206_12_plen_107_part_01